MIVSTRPAEFADRLRDFRSERLDVIRQGEVPGNLESGARLAVHVVPGKAFDGGPDFDFTSFRREPDSLQPIYSYSHDSVRYNFDGMVCVAKGRELIYSYVQLFRSGVIEAVNTSMLETEAGQQPVIPGGPYEHEVALFLSRSLPLLKELRVELPLYVMLSLLGVKGYTMAVPGGRMHRAGYPIDRDDLLVPAVRVDAFDADIHQIMRPSFDRVWNAAGLPRSRSYDEAGNWTNK